jgi:hypothetical protein
MTMIDLRQIVRDVLAETSATDIHVIAQQVLSRITPDQQLELMATLITPYVRVTIGQERRVGRTPQGSAKVTTIRSWWARELEQRYHVGTEYLPLRVMTADQLLVSATERRNHAVGLVHEANRLEKLAAVMQEQGVKTVGKLPQSLAVDVWVSME